MSKTQTPAEKSRVDRTETTGRDERAESVEQRIEQARQHLEAGHPKKAIDALGRSSAKSARLLNAVAVCQIRMGDPEKALEILRPLVVQGGIHLRSDISPALKLSFAAALATAGNLEGFLATMHEVRDEEHPAVGKYREAYRRWKASRTFWDKVKSFFGGQPSQPFAFDFPPGELM